MSTFKCLLLLSLTMCVSGYAGGSAKNQPDALPRPEGVEAGVFIRSVQGGRFITGVERRDYSSNRYFCNDWGDALKLSPTIIRGWTTNYEVMSKALIRAAKKEHLDSPSLAKILQIIRADPYLKNLAVLPVAAHTTKVKGELVWAVALRWEIKRWAVEDASLGHDMCYEITQKTLKLVGHRSCE